MDGFITKATMEVDGYIGNDYEMRYTPKGQAVGNLSVAVGGGNYPAEWFTLVFWGDNAELVNTLPLSKGRAVKAKGRVNNGAYIGKDGKAKPDERVTPTSFEFENNNGDFEKVELDNRTKKAKERDEEESSDTEQETEGKKK